VITEAQWSLTWKHVTKDRPIHYILSNIKVEEIALIERVQREEEDPEDPKKKVKVWWNRITLIKDNVRIEFK